jgi:hypothetical protein
VEAIQPHDEALDSAAFAEEFVDLLFGSVEGKVADVERCGGGAGAPGAGAGATVGGGAALALVLSKGGLLVT